MKHIILFTFYFLTPWLITIEEAPKKVSFFEGDFKKAQSKAAHEGKLYMVDFYASWCMPCKFMDETTFSDPSVTDYIQENYIAAKINIDDLDGLLLKEQYDISQLPTILIFSSTGELLERREESLSATKLLRMLKMYNYPENRQRKVIKRAPLVPNKIKAQEVVATKSTYEEPAKPVEQSDVVILDSPITEESKQQQKIDLPPDVTPFETAYKAEEPQPIEASDKMQQTDEINHNLAPTTEAITIKGFSVQIGVFSEHNNALELIRKIEQKFEINTMVQMIDREDRIIYKVLAGNFKARINAEELKSMLASEQIEGIVKDLTKMK